MLLSMIYLRFLFFFNQKTAYELRISDWSSDVCSSGLAGEEQQQGHDIAPDDRFLAPDPVGEAARDDEADHAECRRAADDDLGRGIVDLHRSFQKGQAGKHGGIPAHGQAGGNPEQGDADAPGVAGIGATLLQRVERTIYTRNT